MDPINARKLMEKGINCLEKGWADDAIVCFEEVLVKYGRIASVISWLGLSIARAKKGDLRPAEMLCLEAIEKEYYIPNYYRNLSEVYLIWDKKPEAIQVLKKGLRSTKGDELLVNELKKLGVRRKPPIPFLERSHPLNILIGRRRYRMATSG